MSKHISHHLTGIKAIAKYLDVSRSGAKRRIRRGMPVYRDGQTVWAIAKELDEWRVMHSVPSKTPQAI